ncbi:MAG: metallophosphoesterase [Clostridia bacterium]|nr:metallophosphoesterase [Clostridia bacterium]MBQ8771705.1 metallophosphoesterase [Clostridia bacterium]MBQ9707441.1 metallophosphoesterase [Clostridia bacterium]
MKVFAISDLHLSTNCQKPMDIFGKSWVNYFELICADWKAKVSQDDVVLLPGDFSWAMRMEDALADFELVAQLPGKKVILRGNHDYWWNTLSQVRNAIPKDFFALQNDCLRFGDVLICGTRGWVCPDGDNLNAEDKKIYLREVERLKLSIASMQKQRQPEDKVIAIMHYPPFNGRYEDSDFVKQFVQADIKTVVYGHLHGKDCRSNLYMKKFGIDFYLTSCDLVGNVLTEIV